MAFEELKERQGVIDDLSAIRDRIRGVYGISADLPMRNAARAACRWVLTEPAEMPSTVATSPTDRSAR